MPFSGTPGSLNAITDVPGVLVGYRTLIRGDNIRTGITAILPRGPSNDPVFGGHFVLNGNGEFAGLSWLAEGGFVDGPILITNTHSVGIVRDSVIQWQIARDKMPLTNREIGSGFSLPLVAETADFRLNDMNKQLISKEDVFAALDSAGGNSIEEGNVGGGTGMIAFGWKGGTGTSSRKIGDFHIGCLVQANHGASGNLIIGNCPFPESPPIQSNGAGSIIIILATDAPLLPNQLDRVAKRGALGIAKSGGMGEHGSGDFIVAFSTANPAAAVSGALLSREPGSGSALSGASTSNPTHSGHSGGAGYKISLEDSNTSVKLEFMAISEMDKIFEATIQVVDEAIINALVAAKPMTGFNQLTVQNLPHPLIREKFARH